MKILNEKNFELLNNLRDPKFYLEHFCKVKSKVEGIVPFILKESQKDLFNTIARHDRIIILKARQLGISTAMVGWMYHNTIMNPGTNTAIIGYNAILTEELLDTVKTLYNSTPDSLKPTIHYNTRHDITFPKLNSKIIVLPSTENVGRGFKLNNVLATELSSWEKAEEKMMTLEASVPIKGKIVVESTPKNLGNMYSRMWFNDNDYVKKRYGWWWEYSLDDIEIISRRMNNPMKFAQEYGLKFLTSGRGVFDTQVIEEQSKNVLEVGDEIVDLNNKVHKVHIDDFLRIYKEPVAGNFYSIGVDVGQGVQGGDYSVVTVWDRKTGEEVAFFRGYIPADRLGEKLNVWGRKYNNALMVVEINNHGLTTVTALKRKLYPNLYFRPSKLDMGGTTFTSKIGWRTTGVTRPLLIDEFAQACREKALIIHSKEILDEMSVLVYNDNGDMVCQSGFHDDCIFSAAIGFQGFKLLCSEIPKQIDYKDYLPKSFNY